MQDAEDLSFLAKPEDFAIAWYFHREVPFSQCLLDKKHLSTKLKLVHTCIHQIRFNKASTEKAPLAKVIDVNTGWESSQEQETWVVKNVKYSAV